MDAAAVSRQHATFQERSGLFYCVDLGSRNGTYVNGRGVTDAPVGPGDIVRCGDSVWVVGRLGQQRVTSGIRQLAPDLYGGDSLAEALTPLRRLAPTALAVVLEGETGVGKELVARALHTWSGRTGKYVAVNCAALPEALAEGELFGYRRGAFTGAERSHLGVFRAAHNGTLLLDEICELPLQLQAKLLRVLEQREVTPLGESAPVALDIRIVAAAQRPLRHQVEAGRFREDLYTRLGVNVRIPPLRERLEDVPALFLHLLAQRTAEMPQLQARFVESLLRYRFPRNVRELRQLTEWIALMCPGERLLRRSHLPEWMLLASEHEVTNATRHSGQSGILPCREQGPARSLSEGAYRADASHDLPRLLASLELHRGNLAKAAEAIGLSRHQAYRLIRNCPEISLDRIRRAQCLRLTGGEHGENDT